MTTAAVPTDRLGDILLREGLLSREKLVQALAEHRSTGMPLGYILAKQGLVPEVEVTRVVARQLRVPAVDLSRFEVDQKLIRLIPADIAKRHIMLALKREGCTLTVAMANPTDQVLLQELRFITASISSRCSRGSTPCATWSRSTTTPPTSSSRRSSRTWREWRTSRSLRRPTRRRRPRPRSTTRRSSSSSTGSSPTRYSAGRATFTWSVSSTRCGCVTDRKSVV